MRRSRAQGESRSAVIDIGSNSVRLVVYEGSGRAPAQIFNEKVTCGLGRDLDAKGQLHKDGVASAKPAIVRFARIARALGANPVFAIATAAVRDAADGPAFVEAIERKLGLKVRTISGAEEGRLSALGVISSVPGARGFMGDLGGASVELVEIAKGRPGRSATLGLGPLRLDGLPKPELRRRIEAGVASVPWLARLKGRNFYPVGGAWRALAGLHMAKSRYPLHIIHHYTLERDEAQRFAGWVSGTSPDKLALSPGLSRRRAETLPFAAMLLNRLLDAALPDRLIFCVHGVREGLLFDSLSARERDDDPLLESARALMRRLGRFPGEPEMIAEWVAPLFAHENAAERRLREAACILGDLGWKEHPDYRAEHAFLRALRLPFVGIDHPGRVFLALALLARQGRPEHEVADSVRSLLSAARRKEALALGLALRLGFSFSGGVASHLKASRLELTQRHVRLHLARRHRELLTEAVGRRLDVLATALDRKAEVIIAE
jgi:exopolyphosphatase / guanosine-5'-triphosphate,3'-diphosphate pyrophosphatase